MSEVGGKEAWLMDRDERKDRARGKGGGGEGKGRERGEMVLNTRFTSARELKGWWWIEGRRREKEGRSLSQRERGWGRNVGGANY